MKKRLFIYSTWMQIGGIESSLISILKELDYSRVAVDLMLASHSGPWMAEIPREVNLLPERPLIRHAWLDRALTKIAICASGVWYRIFRRMKVDEVGFGQIRSALREPFWPKRVVGGRYDLALIFNVEPLMARHVSARTKIAWVHTDWGHFHPIAFLANRQFKCADYIVNVSPGARRSFDRYLNPANRRKSIVVENVLSEKWMMERCDRYRVPAFDGLKIITVGRLTPQKNLFRALEAARILKNRGIRFLWYLVGGGEIEDAVRSRLRDSGLEGCVRMTGAVDNPYPYYKWADLYVCTSDYEGKSVSVREAQVFGLPTIITRFPTSGAQLEEGVDGVVAELSAESVAEKILLVMSDAALRERLQAACRERDYANRGEIGRIMGL